MPRFLPAALVGLSAVAAAQEPGAGLAALRQACIDAGRDAVVLNIAAHPDDESSRTDVILRRKYGLRVVGAYTTYGDGGQNAIGREIGPELADLRVRETLRAAAISDFEVRWLGMSDFGFSKTLEETLKVWGEERLLNAMRALVDSVQPDLVFTNHNLTQGHGHHRASFWAIDKVLKERQAAGLPAIPLYVRANLRDQQVTFEPSEVDPVRGETYARLAHRSWTHHVTQGPWGPHNPLQVTRDMWKLVLPEGTTAERAAAPLGWITSVFDSPACLAACKARGLEASKLEAELGEFVSDRPVLEQGARAARLLPELLQVREALHETHSDGAAVALRRLDRRIDAVQRVLLAAHGIDVEVWVEREEVPISGEGRAYVVVHGIEATADLEVRCGGVKAEPAQAQVRAAPGEGMGGATVGGGSDAGGVPGTSETQPENAPPPETRTRPAPRGRYMAKFTWPHNGDGAPLERLNWHGIGKRHMPQWVQLDVAFTVAGVPVQLQPRRWFTPVEPVELQWDRVAVMVPRGQVVERILSASVVKHRDADLTESVRLAMGVGIRAEAIPGRLVLTREHPEARLLVKAKFDGKVLEKPGELRLELAGQRAAIAVVPVDVAVPPGLKVGLVRGPDDTVERALADLGVAYTALGRDDMAVARLEDFGTLLLDMRAYYSRPELAENRDRLLQYCRAGGRIVAMYHKEREWNERTGHPLLAPFPMTIGNERVTEEDSPVVMLQPEHRLWNHPHKITVDDFAGWVQERGLNFPSKWDAAWAPLLEMKDSGDKQAHQGALLYTQYGRGDFVYCSLVLYRQLRSGHAGAARILVNLLSR